MPRKAGGFGGRSVRGRLRTCGETRKETELDWRQATSREGRSPEERRDLKARNIALATGGHLLALLVLRVLAGIGVSELQHVTWARMVLLMLAVQATLWIVARQGWDEKIDWDPHYLHVPILASAVLFALYIHMAAESRFVLLEAWFVVLLFAAGRIGFREVAGHAVVMSLLYLGMTWHLAAEGEELSLAFEGVRAGVFFAVNLFAGVVFERLRAERRETRELRRTLAEQAVTDPLTGLPNRRYMKEFLESELARIRRYGGRCAVAMVDVDDFKNYNDTLGHPAGDEVLRMLGQGMEEDVRISDVVARYGGEEFGVIMVNTGPQEAVEAGRRLRRRIEARAFPREEIQPGRDLTVSVGVACCPEDGDTYDELIESADEALYRAKRNGKNQVLAA